MPFFLRRRWLGLVILFLLLASTPPAVADAESGQLTYFAVTGDYQLLLDGEETLLTEVFDSPREVCLLVLARELPAPLLVDLKTLRAELVPPSSVERRAEGGVVLTSDGSGLGDWLDDGSAAQWAAGDVARRRGEIRFDLGEHSLVLTPRLPQVGPQAAEAVRRRHPELGASERKALAAKSTDGAVEALREIAEPVRVRVYFGSWCSSCERLMGNVLALEQQLAGSQIRFEYWGLPKPFDDDAVARSEGVQGVPVADVSIGGDRIGRLESLELVRPAASLLRLLTAAP